jgi:hypothetical protein
MKNTIKRHCEALPVQPERESKLKNKIPNTNIEILNHHQTSLRGTKQSLK